MSYRKPPKLPKKSKTLTDKIRKEDWWRKGKELADLIDKEWTNIQGIEAHSLASFNHQLGDILKEFSDKNHLSSYHVSDYISCKLKFRDSLAKVNEKYGNAFRKLKDS